MKILVLALALVMSTTLLSTAGAKVEKPTIKFSALATGECLIMPSFGPGPMDGPLFIGKGTIVVSGSATAAVKFPPTEPLFVAYYITLSGVEAQGRVSVRWGESKLDVTFGSSAATGFFTDDGLYSDSFFAGAIPGVPIGPPLMALSYSGIIQDSAGTRTISGDAITFSMPIGTSVNPKIGIILLNLDGSVMKAILWSPVDEYVGPEAVILRAANAFVHSVKTKD